MNENTKKNLWETARFSNRTRRVLGTKRGEECTRENHTENYKISEADEDACYMVVSKLQWETPGINKRFFVLG